MIHIFPFTSYKVECDAYNPWSVKFFADGSLGVCNATHYNKRILERSSTNTDAEYVQKILSPYKNNISKNNNQCLNCSLIGICRGKIYCDNGLCNPMNNVDFDIFIKEYVEQLNNNNGKYFTFLGTN